VRPSQAGKQKALNTLLQKKSDPQMTQIFADSREKICVICVICGLNFLM
jgi:hypothetical protein